MFEILETNNRYYILRKINVVLAPHAVFLGGTTKIVLGFVFWDKETQYYPICMMDYKIK